MLKKYMNYIVNYLMPWKQKVKRNYIFNKINRFINNNNLTFNHHKGKQLIIQLMFFTFFNFNR